MPAIRTELTKQREGGLCPYAVGGEQGQARLTHMSPCAVFYGMVCQAAVAQHPARLDGRYAAVPGTDTQTIARPFGRRQPASLTVSVTGTVTDPERGVRRAQGAIRGHTCSSVVLQAAPMKQGVGNSGPANHCSLSTPACTHDPNKTTHRYAWLCVPLCHVCMSDTTYLPKYALLGKVQTRHSRACRSTSFPDHHRHALSHKRHLGVGAPALPPACSRRIATPDPPQPPRNPPLPPQNRSKS